jgi:hypothetical protein
LVSLSKKQKVDKCLPFHFWAVSSVKMKFNWTLNWKPIQRIIVRT